MTLVATLAVEAGLSDRDVLRIIITAPKRYKTFTIPKRNGGERMIAQPAFEVKVLQRILMMRILSQFPVHDAAYAYVKGRSIRQNALRHVNSDFILKLDFRNFFNSIRPMHLERLLSRKPPEGIDRSEYESIYQLLFWGAGSYLPQCLSIGAPSSPMISNIVMYEFDLLVSEMAAELGVGYTRYADDLTISSSSSSAPLLAFEQRLTRLLPSVSPHLRLNEAKRGLYDRGKRRMVTGLIITPDGKVSIGRERKRAIRAAVHRVTIGNSDDRLLMRCKGMLGFVIAAEPSYLHSLIDAYGRDKIKAILHAPQVSFYREIELEDIEF
ncbi:MAG: retron St85 family RNA-directed DNA polymerase [Sphingomicrobium sp.]